MVKLDDTCNEIASSLKLMDIVPRAVDVDREILDLFTVLAVASKENRIAAVAELIEKLNVKQSDATEPCQEVLYSLKRLIKGLSSTRKLARVGYPLALCQILRQFPGIDAPTVLQMIEEYLDLSKADSATEKTNMEVGIALAYSAVIQSDLLLKGNTSAALQPLLHQLMTFQSDRAYVQHIWRQCLPLYIRKLVTHPEFDSHIWPPLQSHLSQGWTDATPERLEVLLLCKHHLPAKVDKQFLKQHWLSKTVVSKKTHRLVLAVLEESTRGHPIIHNVGKLLLQDLPPDGITDFWTEVGEILFHGELSKRRLGMFLLSELIRKPLTIEQISMMLSKQVCQMMYTDLRFNHKETPSAQMVLDSLASLLSTTKDDSLHSTVLQCFTQSLEGEKTQITELHSVLSVIVPHLTTAVLEKLSEEFRNLVEGRTFYGLELTSVSVRQWAVNQLGLFFSHAPGQQQQQEEEGLRSFQAPLLKYLFRHAFFQLVNPASNIPHCDTAPLAFGEKLQKSCHMAFVKNFLKVINIKADKSKKLYISQTTRDIFSYVETLVRSPAVVKPLRELDEETLQALLQIKKMLSQLQSTKTNQSESKNIYAFETLLIYLGLQVFCDPNDSLDVIQDSVSCCEKAIKKKRKGKSSDDEPDWLDVLLDVLISMMTHPSKLSRAIATSIFSAVTDHITPLSLGLLTEILMKKTSDMANDEDFTFGDKGEGDDSKEAEEDDEEEEEEEEEEEMEQEDNDDDEEEEEEEEEEGDEVAVGGDKDKDDDSDDSDDDDGEEANMEVDEDFRRRVKEALGPAADDSDDSEVEEELSDLSDSEMDKCDEALAAVFRNHNRSKIQKETRDRKQQLITLKIRLLDFIEVLIKQNHQAEIVMPLFQPLLHLRDCSERDRTETTLGEKATRLYRQLYKTKVNPETYHQLTKQDVVSLISQLIEFARKAPTVGLMVDVSDAIYFLCKLLLNKNSHSEKPDSDKQIHKDLLKVFQPSLNGFLDSQGYQTFFCFYQNIIGKLPLVFWQESGRLVTVMASEEVTEGGEDTKVTKRLKAARLLCCMVDKNMHQKLKSSKWKTFVTSTVPVIVKILQQPSGAVKPKLLDQVMCLFRSLLTLDRGQHLHVVPVSVVETLHSLKKCGPRSQHKACNSLIQLLHRQGLHTTSTGPDTS
ncbi:myb-binding 1A [Argonauta hians]